MFSLASLPNPAEPAFIAFGGVMGTLVGGAIARFGCYDSDNKMHWTVEGSYYGTALSACIYVAAKVLGVVFG